MAAPYIGNQKLAKTWGLQAIVGGVMFSGEKENFKRSQRIRGLTPTPSWGEIILKKSSFQKHFLEAPESPTFAHKFFKGSRSLLRSQCPGESPGGTPPQLHLEPSSQPSGVTESYLRSPCLVPTECHGKWASGSQRLFLYSYVGSQKRSTKTSKKEFRQDEVSAEMLQTGQKRTGWEQGV